MADEVPLRDYVEALFREREKAVEAALAASEKAVAKSEVNAEKWRDSANEWRGQSADRERSQAEQMAKLSGTFLPRETFDSIMSGWQEWRAIVEQRLNSAQGEKRGVSAFQAVTLDRIVAVIAFATLLAYILIHG